ncbi:MAG: CRISPR system precrRNA processing endoribonuclease RAMP protein Cas6 [Salinibacter sp.]
MAGSPLSPAYREILAALPQVRTAQLRLTYRATGTIELPSPPVSVWRGQLGRVLHRLSSEGEHKHNQSLYQHLFRTPRGTIDLPEGLDGRTLGALGLAGEHVPSPFVLRLAESHSPATAYTIESGETVTVEMVLFEDAVRHVPPLTAAFEELENQGLGQKTRQPDGHIRRGTATLDAATLAIGPVSVSLYDGTGWSLPPEIGPSLFDRAESLTSASNAPSPSPERSTAVDLATPLRLKHKGALVRPDALTADALAANVFRRRLGLAVCYGSASPSDGALDDWRDAFFALADATTLDVGDLRWVNDTRYSSRQDRRHPTGGLVGRLVINGPAAEWHRVLRPLQNLHLGKKTALGLGRIHLPEEEDSSS